MKRLLVIVIVAVLSFFFGAVSQVAPRLFGPVIVEKTRLDGLAEARCRDSAWTQQDSIFVKQWFQPRWPAATMKDINGCVAEFELDSGFLGTVAVKSSSRQAREYEFFNQFDTRLVRASDPSFVLRAFQIDGDWWGFDTLDGGLGRLKADELTYFESPSTTR